MASKKMQHLYNRKIDRKKVWIVKLEFRDLKRQYKFIKTNIDANIAEVISSAHFISGPEVRKLEQTLASYVGVKHCISCANGTDAISIALLTHGVGAGDAVFVPDFTFFSSGECPAAVGATPIFVDVDPVTYNIDPTSLVSVIEKVISEGELKPRVVVAVDLFGQPFNYPAIKSICDRYNLLLLEDAAQGFGGSITVEGEKKMACSLGDISTTSFFPAKPLGCYGDGGAIFTDNDSVASLCRSIAIHGKEMDHPDDPVGKYNNTRIGMNSRLDTLQAAILLAKFPIFKDFEIEAVNKVAGLYTDLLNDTDLVLPIIKKNYYSSWAQYTVQLPPSANREAIRNSLEKHGIPTNVYYARPMHKQAAFFNTRSAIAYCPLAEELCEKVLCIPIHPYLRIEEIEAVVSRLKEVL